MFFFRITFKSRLDQKCLTSNSGHWSLLRWMIVQITNDIICLLVKVKWGRESFPNIEVNTDEEPLLFKAQLYALTGVEPNRQKVMSQGIVLKDEEWNMTMRNVNA